uniref:THD domain-containing protein n=1 Tax=Anabas testudineus TaxID=64144 RepID=A0A7N6FAL1_ANATE
LRQVPALLLLRACTFTTSILKLDHLLTIRQHHKEILCFTCPADSMPGDNITDEQYIKWQVLFGDGYNKERRAIVIPQTGVYFVYVKTDIHCHNVNGAANFYVELQSWNEGYPAVQTLSSALDGLVCPNGAPRTVVVGELLDLLEGDHVSVWVVEGFKLMSKSSFGAFFL